MTKLRELEQRLRDEPDNLGLRVMVAGALHEAGRRDDAIELYRSVAVAYRDQGRPQQAIMVCRSVLEIAPDDAACRDLLAALIGPAAPARPSPPRISRLSSPQLGEPERRSSAEMTPLPAPLAYHDADPTRSSPIQLTPSDLPPSLREELAGVPQIAGIAAAARQISASLIAAQREADDAEDADARGDRGPLPDDPEVRRIPWPRAPLLAATELPRSHGLTPPPLQEPTHSGEEDEPTLPPRWRGAAEATTGSAGIPVGIDDDVTLPRELPGIAPLVSLAPAAASGTTASVTDPGGPLAGVFFAPLPARNRAAVLQRFRRRIVSAGQVVIQRGEIGHGLVVVVRGRLELRAAIGETTAAAVVLEVVEPGGCAGEASLLSHGPAADDAVAPVESELLVLAADDFDDVTRSFPALRAALESLAGLRARIRAERMA